MILRTNLNSGTPWSEMALADLRYTLEHGDSLEQAATFLCRDIDEVQAKAEELGLVPEQEKASRRGLRGE